MIERAEILFLIIGILLGWIIKTEIIKIGRKEKHDNNR